VRPRRGRRSRRRLRRPWGRTRVRIVGLPLRIHLPANGAPSPALVASSP
jgi:hypothetical protein